ncbi:MAG TPA: hypothetical protein VFW87_01425 [Pirellulales bacterium]|nr:hypothetical protein [Pirellulales bacterium]
MNIIIYAVEGQAPFRQRALSHLQSLLASGFSFAISDFVRLECLIKPLAANDGALLLDYDALLTHDQRLAGYQGISVQVLP